MSKLEQIIADIKELKLLEVAELVKMMEEEFGVSAAAAVAVVGGGGDAGAAAVSIAAHTRCAGSVTAASPNSRA